MKKHTQQGPQTTGIFFSQYRTLPDPFTITTMISHTLIVLAVIVGAGVSVLLGWSITHHFESPGAGDIDLPAQEANQAIYMREVRLRHHDELATMFGGQRALV